MALSRHPQLTRHGELAHLLTLDGLPRRIVTHILDTAERFVDISERAGATEPLLSGQSVCMLFFEDTLRVRRRFEAAAVGLSANVSRLAYHAEGHSQNDAFLAAIHQLAETRADLIVVRHPQSGAAFQLANHCPPHSHVINAGDDQYTDPTLGLADMLMIRHDKHDFTGLTVAVVGDILHSPIARSDIHALTTLGVPEVRAIGPRTLLPFGLEDMGVRVLHDMEDGLRDVDVIIVLPLSRGVVGGMLMPSAREYFARWGLTPERLALAKADAIVIHPGMRDVEPCGLSEMEIDTRVANGAQSRVRDQAGFGMAVRMAVMSILATSESK